MTHYLEAIRTLREYEESGSRVHQRLMSQQQELASIQHDLRAGGLPQHEILDLMRREAALLRQYHLTMDELSTWIALMSAAVRMFTPTTSAVPTATAADMSQCPILVMTATLLAPMSHLPRTVSVRYQS